MQKDLLGTRIIALLLAVLFWFQTVLTTEHKSTVKIPVQLLNSPRELNIEGKPDFVPFIVQGKGIDILKFIVSRTKISIDASKLKPGEDLLSLNNYQLEVPENIKLTLIGPASKDDIQIQANAYRERSVPIQLSFRDEYTRTEFQKKRVSLSPERATISGPESLIRNMKALNTTEITRDLLRRDSFDVGVIVPDEMVNSNVSVVKVQLSASQVTSRVIYNLSISNTNNRNYFPNRITVKLSGEKDLLDSLKTSSISVELNSNQDSDGMYPIRVLVPDGIEVIGVTPTKTRVIN